MSFATPNVRPDKYTGFTYEGKPIVLAKQRGVSLKKEYHKSTWHPEEKRLEVATLWAATKDITQVSNLTGITPHTIRKWQKEPWFQNIVQRVIEEKNDLLDKELSNIIHKAVDLLRDRLENGDVRVNYNTQKSFRVEVDARTISLLLSNVFEKRQLLRGEATSRSETVQQVSYDKRLKELQDAFTKYSQSVEIEGDYKRGNNDNVNTISHSQEQEAENKEEKVLKEASTELLEAPRDVSKEEPIGE